jgi:hypothetical protein
VHLARLRAAAEERNDMKHHGYCVAISDQVFVDGNDEEIGAVRQVLPDQV